MKYIKVNKVDGHWRGEIFQNRRQLHLDRKTNNYIKKYTKFKYLNLIKI